MHLPMILAGRAVSADRPITVFAPWDGRALHEVSQAGPAEMEAAAAAAAASLSETRALAPWRRAEILRAAASLVRARAAELSALIRDEAGKPVSLARVEVARAADTLDLCADEARRAQGEVVPVDAVAAGADRVAFTRRVPRGPVLAITPFNFPLNLVCHKVGPAVAAGCPLVIKPAEQTPGAALLLGEILLAAGWPERALSVLPADRSVAPQLVADPRFRVISFTGSDRVGWAIRTAAPRAQVVLELGGNGAVILEPDADLDAAVPRIVAGAYGYAGQVCISVQHVLVARARHEELRARLIEAVRRVPEGDPARDDVVCGPMIDRRNVGRVQSWVQEATDGGATVLAGGQSAGNLLSATLLEGVPGGAALRTEEAFGPVAHLDAYDTIDEAFERVNQSRYGLQVGLYTRDVRTLLRAQASLDVGGIIHDDVPTFRADPMPYGGVKDSGFGREGPRYAIEEMTEPRLLVLRAR